MRMQTLLAALLIVAVSIPLSAQGTQSNAEPIGDVFYVVTEDAMTDEKQGMVMARSDDQKLWLNSACHQGRFAALLSVQDPVLSMDMITMDQGRPEVQYRVDDQEPVGPLDWRQGGEPSDVGIWGEQAQKFANDLKFGEQVAVRLWNSAGERVLTKTIPIDGLAKALARLPCFVQTR